MYTRLESPYMLRFTFVQTHARADIQRRRGEPSSQIALEVVQISSSDHAALLHSL